MHYSFLVLLAILCIPVTQAACNPHLPAVAAAFPAAVGEAPPAAAPAVAAHGNTAL